MGKAGPRFIVSLVLLLGSPLQAAQFGLDIVDPFEASFEDLAPERSESQQVEPSEFTIVDEHELANEIGPAKLAFAWRQLPTSKCSRACGRGNRILHVSCIDLKYQVRVGDELCLLKSAVPRPNETSEDEFCNEFDCQPQWSTVEIRQTNKCNATAEQTCQPDSVLKRAQCVMLDRNGRTIELDESRCNSSVTSSPAGSTNGQVNELRQRLDDDRVELISFEDAAGDSDEAQAASTNQILQPEATPTRDKSSVQILQNDPFFEPSPWSECSGAKCGQLGKRHRRVTCRLLMSRSSRLIELPESSCRASGAAQPDLEEPCYLDCPSGDFSELSHVSQVSSNETILSTAQGGEETFYDLEMTRYHWKTDGWTRCSSDCSGGQRESIIECWDRLTESRVDVAMCEPELKPKPVVEPCNEIPCAPEWRIEPYGRCSRPCGSAGFRSRLVSCVQRIPSHPGSKQAAYMSLSSEQCKHLDGGETPAKQEPCNRIDCRPEWVVGGWSECSSKCGYGYRNRSVICIQEFASRDGPSSQRYGGKMLSADMLEAIEEFALEDDWQPGKQAQVPFQECYEEYRMVPSLEEKCFSPCEEEIFIDADPQQDLDASQATARKKTITIRVGGRASLAEGKNVKIRCKVMKRQWQQADAVLVKKVSVPIEWRYLGHRIFPNGTHASEKHQSSDESSLTMDNDIIGSHDIDQSMQADQPSASKPGQASQGATMKRRNLAVRSWSYRSSQDNSKFGFKFLPQQGGRFTLIRDSTLRINRLRPDDSGLYSCSYGSLNESIELKVTRHRATPDGSKLQNELINIQDSQPMRIF